MQSYSAQTVSVKKKCEHFETKEDGREKDHGWT